MRLQVAPGVVCSGRSYGLRPRRAGKTTPGTSTTWGRELPHVVSMGALEEVTLDHFRKGISVMMEPLGN